MSRQHNYNIQVKWLGNTGKGTNSYKEYKRDHQIIAEGKEPILGSSDPSFLGDKSMYNPEELLVASLSSCHMLWYLHLCADNKIVVVEYDDKAIGTMIESTNGGGCFTEVTLQPRVIVTKPEMIAKAIDLHKEANALCFIARSVNFPVKHEPEIYVSE